VAAKLMRLVWEHGPNDFTMKLVLLCLADHAHNLDGTECWPSIARIADMCSLTERSVISKLNELERGSWIRRMKVGRRKEYQVIINRMKPEQSSPVIPEGYSGDEGVEHMKSMQRNMKSTAETPEIHCKPPHPHIGGTVFNRNRTGSKPPSGRYNSEVRW
jgi:hypothetical protein